jgi:hypothetical protein
MLSLQAPVEPRFKRAGCAAVLAASLVLLAAGCGSGAGPTPARGSDIPGKEIRAADFATQRFDHSTNIDNRWFPLRPGTQWIYAGSTRQDGRRVAHRDVFTVTDLTKVVAGVRTVVIWDRDYSGGRLVEGELTFFAQDNDGNVWHLGQYPEEYEQGKFVGAPAWLAGLKGAKAGIVMKARPHLGAPSYSQGFAPPPINWVDHAKVDKVGARTCVPAGCYDNVLVTREFETGKPQAFQVKYYARGVGNVRTGWAGAKDEDHEVLVLVKLRHLGPAALARVRASALEMERRAYRVSKDVYGRTPRAVPR